MNEEKADTLRDSLIFFFTIDNMESFGYTACHCRASSMMISVVMLWYGQGCIHLKHIQRFQIIVTYTVEKAEILKH